MRKVLLLFCLTVVIAASAQENWEDSVKVYREQARNGNTEAYLKLAECYHEGKGVEHNFLQVFWMMMQAMEEIGDERANQFFLNMPEDDIDRVKYDAVEAFVNGNIQKLKVVNQQLAKMDAGSGKLVEGLICMLEKKNDEAVIHFTRAEELGCVLAGVCMMVYVKPSSEDDYINTLLKIGKEYPFVYNYLGDFMVETINKDPERRIRAIEYYKLADEYASLGKEGKAFLKSSGE